MLLSALPGTACDLRLQSTPGTITGTYQPDGGLTVTGTITVGHRGPATHYFITFSAGQSGDFSARYLASGINRLDYQLYDNLTGRNVLKSLVAKPSPAEVLSGCFPCSYRLQQQSLTFVVFLPPGQLPPVGQYRDTVLIGLYAGTPSCHERRSDRACMAISIGMNPIIDVSLVPSGAPFDSTRTSLTLDAGILREGNMLNADLIIRSNSRYSIAVLSRNGGVLRNPDPGDSSQVPYRFLSSGQVWALPQAMAQPIVTGGGPTTMAGARYAISVIVGEVDWVTEGHYSDVLTFQAAAN
jgi:hypothetical protein